MKSRNKLIGIEFLVIPLFTFFVYISTYAYEFGIASVTHIPYEMVSISSSVVFSDMLSLSLSISVIIINILSFYYLKTSPFKRMAVAIALFLISLFITIPINKTTLFAELIMFFIFLFLIVSINKIKESEALFFHGFMAFLASFIIVFIYFYTLGLMSTQDKKIRESDIIRTKDGSQYVLIKAYGDNLFLRKLSVKGDFGGLFYIKSDDISFSEIAPKDNNLNRLEKPYIRVN